MATLTPAEFAAEIGTDARTARKFLRSITPKDEQPGKGSRWAIEKRSVRSLRKRFTEWSEAQEAARQDRAEKRAAEVDESPAEDDEPTPEALAEIESETDE